MKALFLTSIFLAVGFFQVNAQEHQKQFGIGGQVGYSDVFWTASNTNKVDSFNQLDHGILGVSPQLWYFVEFKRYSSIQIGLQYSMTGFERRAEDISFGTTYHPDLPKVTALVQGDPRHIDFVYRAHYVEVPVLWNREIIAFRKSVSLHYFFTPGISFGFMAYDKTIAHTRGFGFDGTNRFRLNNMYEGNPFSMKLHLGGRLEYLIDAKYRAHFQPMINVPITSYFTNGNKAYVPSAGFNIIISMIPGKESGSE